MRPLQQLSQAIDDAITALRILAYPVIPAPWQPALEQRVREERADYERRVKAEMWNIPVEAVDRVEAMMYVLGSVGISNLMPREIYEEMDKAARPCASG